MSFLKFGTGGGGGGGTRLKRRSLKMRINIEVGLRTSSRIRRLVLLISERSNYKVYFSADFDNMLRVIDTPRWCSNHSDLNGPYDKVMFEGRSFNRPSVMKSAR